MLEQTNELGKLISGKEKKTLSLMDNSKAIKESQSPPSTHIIAVTSGKGGVGKSTLCVNLGISLANMGFKVLLLDGDLGLANLNVLMGIIPDHSLYDVIRGKKKLSDIIISTSFGLDIIAGANGISQLADISQSQRELLVRQLADLNGYDIMLIDTGAGINANVISLALASDEILVITTPEPTSITDAYAMIKSIVVHDPQRTVRLLINRAPSALEAKRAADRLKSITSRFLSASVDILGFVFEEEVVQKSVRSQRPLMVVYPGAKSSACVSHIGAQLTNLTEQTQPKGIRVFFQNFLGKNQNKKQVYFNSQMLIFIAILTVFGFAISFIFGLLGEASLPSLLFSTFFCILLSMALAVVVYKILEKNVPEVTSVFEDLQSKLTLAPHHKQSPKHSKTTMENQTVTKEAYSQTDKTHDSNQTFSPSTPEPTVTEARSEQTVTQDIDNEYKDEVSSHPDKSETAFITTNSGDLDETKSHGFHKLKDKVKFHDDPKIIAQTVRSMMSQGSKA